MRRGALIRRRVTGQTDRGSRRDSVFRSHRKTPSLRDPLDGRLFHGKPLTLPDGVAPRLLERLETVRHPNLLPVHAVGSAYGEPLRFQEEADGATLEDLIHTMAGDVECLWRHVFPAGVAGLVQQFAALARLGHELNELGLPLAIVHPRQLFVTPRGQLLIHAQDLLQENGVDDPTAALFLPPEVLLSSRRGTLTPEEWVFTLAALLHVALLGIPPRPGRDPAEVADRLLSEETLPIERDPPETLRGIDEVIRASVAFDPRERPQSLRGLAHALELVAEGRRVPTTVRRRSGIRSRRVAMAGLILAGLVAMVGYRIWHAKQSRDYLCEQLGRVVDCRPFPVHGEDPPTHPVADQLLVDHRNEIERWRRDPRVQVLQGWAYLRSQKSNESLACFRRAVQSDRSSIPGWVSLGIARLESADAGGRTDIYRGLELTPTGASEWLFQGAGHFYLLDFVAASRAFRQFVSRSPESHVGWLHLALSAHYAGDGVACEDALDEAKRIRPRDLWGVWLRAERLGGHEGGGAAVSSILRDEARFLGVPPLQLRAGRLLVRLGDCERGHRWIEEACQRIPASSSLPRPRADEIEWSPQGRLTWPRNAPLLAGPPALK